MIKPRFEDFRYTGVDDSARIAKVVAERVHTPSPTERTGSVDQRLTTFLATPTNLIGDEVLLRLTEFADENGRPSGALFDSTIAESTGRRVMSTNLPGIDFYGNPETKAEQELTRQQAHNLYKGSFREVGAAILKAAQNATTEFSIDPKFIILGTSMSAGIAAGVLNAARETSVDIRGATFAEPVNTVSRSPLKLGFQFLATSRTANGYVAMNPPFVRDISEPITTIVKRATKPTNYLYARALASGSLISDIGTIDYLEDMPIYISRGVASNISPAVGFETLRDHLGQAAEVIAETFGDIKTNPHDHAYVLAVQPFIDAAKNVLERQVSQADMNIIS